MNLVVKNLTAAVATVAMAALLAVPAFAANSPATTVTKAELNVHKILTTDTANSFPTTDSFGFELKPHSVTPGRTAPTGITAPTKATMPMPATVTGTGEDRVATLTVTGLDALGTAGTHKDNADTLATDKFDIVFGDTTANTYSEPGIYTYTLTEKNTPAEAGLIYDASTYFVNVYVTNVIDDTTQQPVLANGKLVTTVSAITVYKTTNGTLNPFTGDEPATPDVTTEDGKQSITTDPKTDEPDTMAGQATIDNKYDTEELDVSKTVTGDLGDPHKEFTFTFAYLTDGPTAPADTKKYSWTKTLADGSTEESNETNMLAPGNTFVLKHKESIQIHGVPAGLKYTVTENDYSNENYTTSYVVQNGATAEVSAVGSIATGTIASSTNDTNVKNSDAFTNDKQSTTPTGVLLRVLPFALLAGLLVFGIFTVTLNGKKRRNNYQGL